MENTFRDLSRFFKALGDEPRLQLVALLTQQEPGQAMCVGRLARELGVTDSAISQHLRVLKDLGLVRAERRGYRLHHFIDSERLTVYQNLVPRILVRSLLVIDDGRIIERGTHDSLLAAKGFYYRLYMSQFARAGIDATVL